MGKEGTTKNWFTNRQNGTSPKWKIFSLDSNLSVRNLRSSREFVSVQVSIEMSYDNWRIIKISQFSDYDRHFLILNCSPYKLYSIASISHKMARSLVEPVFQYEFKCLDDWRCESLKINNCFNRIIRFLNIHLEMPNLNEWMCAII